MDLTGGYDSRLLSLLLSRSGVLARANTRHTTDPREVEIAGRVAAVLGLEWVHPSLPSDWSTVLPAMLDYSLVWGDAQLEVLQLSRVLWPHGLLARRLPHLLSAGGGEHLQFAAWKSEFRAAGRSNRVNYDNWIDMRMLKPVRNAVLAGDPRPAVREDMRARLSSWVGPYADHANTTQLDLLYAYKSTGHFGAYRSADDGLLQAGLPFYFRRTFEAAFSTDFRHRNAHRLMRHMMHRLHPTAAALPTTRGGPAQPWRLSNTHRFAPYYGQLARKAVTKISDQVMGRPLLLERRGFPWAASAHAAVLAVLAPDGASRADHLLSAELYDPRAVEQLLRDAVVPGFEDSALLGRLVTVELALRKVGGGVSR